MEHERRVRPSGRGEAGVDRGHDVVPHVLARVERVDEHAVGDLAREPAHAWSERGQPDRGWAV